jgi:hypothetical protein
MKKAEMDWSCSLLQEDGNCSPKNIWQPQWRTRYGRPECRWDINIIIIFTEAEQKGRIE